MKSILNYHNIERTFSPFFSTITPEIFRTHIKFFKRFSIDIIDFTDYFKKESGIVITIDDGFKGIYETLVELMEQFNFKPIIFVVTNFLGKKSDWDVWLNRNIHISEKEVKYLSSKGVIFGSHTHNHFLLTALNEKEIIYELEYSKKIIEDITGKDVCYLSYPFGRTNEKVVDIAINLGYSNGFLGYPFRFKENDFNIGRWSVYTFDRFINLKLKDDNGGIFTNLEKAKCKLINKYSFLTYYFQKIFT